MIATSETEKQQLLAGLGRQRNPWRGEGAGDTRQKDRTLGSRRQREGTVTSKRPSTWSLSAILGDPRLGLKPKRGKGYQKICRQIRPPHPCPPCSLGCGRDKKNLHLGPHEAGKFKRDGPCPRWRSASPVGRGPVMSAPLPGAAQSQLCSLLKTGSLAGSE